MFNITKFKTQALLFQWGILIPSQPTQVFITPIRSLLP